jgi:tryptophanase
MRGRGAEGPSERTPLDLLRLAVPRRVYSESHLRYVVATFAKLFRERSSIEGVEIVEAPAVLRHFFAKFRPVPLASSSPVGRSG